MLLSLAKAVAVGLLMLGAVALSAQEYPNKPVRIITGLPGGGSDFAARLIAQGISGPLGQPVIVDNRSTNMTAETAMKSEANGYTLLVDGNSFWYVPLFQKNSPYEVLRDFSPVTMAFTAPNIFAVNPSVAANSISELIALAKARPGQLNYSSSGAGSTQHLAMEMFRFMTGINIVHVPYRGGALPVTAVISGEVQMVSAAAAAVAPVLKSGKLKALAVTSAQPSALFPGLPTVSSSGLPGYEMVSRTGLFASGKPPTRIISRLNQEIVRNLNTREVKERFLAAGMETVGNTAEEFAATIRSESARIGKLVKDAGITAD